MARSLIAHWNDDTARTLVAALRELPYETDDGQHYVNGSTQREATLIESGLPTASRQRRKLLRSLAAIADLKVLETPKPDPRYNCDPEEPPRRSQRVEPYDLPQLAPNSEHPTVSLEDWLPLADASLGPRVIHTPLDLAITDTIRRNTFQDYDLGLATPVDICFWQSGAPKKPYLTKLGGVPFRPADRTWPHTREGVPFTFVAQFCFVDSTDILQQLPGDVLLVFFSSEDAPWGQREDVRLEWVNLDCEPIVSCPAPQFCVPEMSASLCRTYEFPEDGWEVFYYVERDQPYLLDTQGTRLGAAAHFIQTEQDYDLIATLNWIDPELIPDSGGDTEWLQFGDGGCMYFKLRESGLWWFMESH